MTDGLNSNLWTTLSDEILDGFSEDETNDDNGLASCPEDRMSIEAGTFTFDPRSSDSSLTHLHPPTVQIFRLWQVFLSNVNPLVKVIHAPMVQQQILESSVNIENVSRPVESLMFAIYSCAITSLSAEECEELTGESRASLRLKYHKAAQQALIRVGLFKTLDILVLQAAVLFLVSIFARFHHGFSFACTSLVFYHMENPTVLFVYSCLFQGSCYQLPSFDLYCAAIRHRHTNPFDPPTRFPLRTCLTVLCRYLSASTMTPENSGFSQVSFFVLARELDFIVIHFQLTLACWMLKFVAGCGGRYESSTPVAQSNLGLVPRP